MKMRYIQEINPSSQGWTAKVIVCDKTQPRLSPTNPIPYLRIILMDEKEQKVTATVYGTDINAIREQLELYKTYKISNVVVERQETKYNIYNYPFQWTLKHFTKIQPQKYDFIHPSILNYRFASLLNLNNYIGKRILVDILAIVLEKKGQHNVKVRGEQMLKKEYLIMNEEKATVLLTLWNNIAISEGPLLDETNEAFPVIRATSLAISPFGGVSLGSTTSTIIQLNPEIPEAANLYNWRRTNLVNLLNGILQQQSFQLTTNRRRIQTTHVAPIQKVIAERMENQFLVQVHSPKVLPAPRYFYISCQYCSTSIHGTLGYLANCPACKKFSFPNPREKIRLRICDGTAAINVAVLGEQASNITGIDAVTSMEFYNKNLIFPIKDINNNLRNKCFLIELRKRICLNKGILENQYMLKDIEFIGTIDYTTITPLPHELYSQDSTTKQELKDEEEERAELEFLVQSLFPDTAGPSWT